MAYGLTIPRSSPAPPRGVLDEPSLSAAGYVIARAGRETERGWQQTEHVVMTREEARRYAHAILALTDADGQQERRVALGEPLLTAKEAAALLAVRPSWIYEAVRSDQLPCLKLGRHIRFTRSMLERWLAQQLP